MHHAGLCVTSLGVWRQVGRPANDMRCDGSCKRGTSIVPGRLTSVCIGKMRRLEHAMLWFRKNQRLDHAIRPCGIVRPTFLSAGQGRV